MDVETNDSPTQSEVILTPLSERHGSLLEHLDRMEQELEKIRNEAPSNTPPLVPDKLDTYEETLKSTALMLDNLLAELMEAEMMEYTYPDFLHPDETGYPNNSATLQGGNLEHRGRNLQEILVIVTLITAVFLVGMTFGLWGSFFFGL